MSNLIEFPLPDRPITESEEDTGPVLDPNKVHAEAFRDLEGEVCDLDRMGEIARNLIMNCAAKEDSFHDLELATFAVWRLAKMLKEFRINYDKRWHNEPVDKS